MLKDTSANRENKSNFFIFNDLTVLSRAETVVRNSRLYTQMDHSLCLHYNHYLQTFQQIQPCKVS